MNKLDLSQLAIPRPSTGAAAMAHPKRRWIVRYLLPLTVLFGFVALLAATAGYRLFPQPSVEVMPVMVQRMEAQQAGARLFQAPGWVEPRPTPVSVPALAAGVVEELLVVEGTQVSRGQPVAKLINIDAQLAVRQSQAALAIREGELKRAVAEREAAQRMLENPVHLQAELADAESMLATAKTELGNLPRLIEKANAELAFAQESLEGKRNSVGAIAGITLRRAEADFAAAQATLEELRGRKPNLEHKVEALERKSHALHQQLDLLIEEKRKWEEAKAKVETATAVRDEAALELQKSELALSRMIIKAPIDGRVLRLVASPGDRVMGMDSTAEHRSSTVIQMYDPQRLQVRADVRLEDVPLVVPGQPVEIETASSRQAIRGRVLLPTSTANVQKNTLEVKIELIDPPTTVTPEMLVTATFLGTESSSRSNGSTDVQRLLIPAELIESTESGDSVWIVDESGRAQRRSIQAGSEMGHGLVEVQSGLNLTDKLVSRGADNLAPGRRVRVEGEDRRLGWDESK